MSMKPRERNIAIVAAAVLGLLALDYFIVTPFLDSRALLISQREMLESDLAKANQTILASQAVRRRWAQFKAAGLQTDASSTENNLLNAMRQWSQEAKLPLASIRPDRATNENGLQEMTFQASSQGTMQAISAFVYRVETTQLPIRIREMQIAARTEAKNDLSMQMRISTLWDDVASTQARTDARAN